MPTELKPCPFCGGSADYENAEFHAQLRCTGCGSLSGLYFYSEEECESGMGEMTEQRCADAWNARAIEAEVLQAQEPVAFPSLPAGIVMHPQLGELYDRLQVQQYAMKYAGLAAPQPPAPFQKRPYNGREISVQDHNEIVDALLAKVAEQNAEIAQLKTVPMKYRRMEFNAQLQAKVSEQSAEIDRLKVCVDDEREIRQRVERGAVAGREQQSERIAELEETRDALWETQRALCNQVYERDMLIEQCESMIKRSLHSVELCEKYRNVPSYNIAQELKESLAAIAAHKKGIAE